RNRDICLTGAIRDGPIRRLRRLFEQVGSVTSCPIPRLPVQPSQPPAALGYQTAALLGDLAAAGLMLSVVAAIESLRSSTRSPFHRLVKPVTDDIPFVIGQPLSLTGLRRVLINAGAPGRMCATVTCGTANDLTTER